MIIGNTVGTSGMPMFLDNRLPTRKQNSRTELIHVFQMLINSDILLDSCESDAWFDFTTMFANSFTRRHTFVNNHVKSSEFPIAITWVEPIPTYYFILEIMAHLCVMVIVGYISFGSNILVFYSPDIKYANHSDETRCRKLWYLCIIKTL